VSLRVGGGTSDKFLTEDCGILNNHLPVDLVLADRGLLFMKVLGFVKLI
jgi:hypothetical protein